MLFLEALRLFALVEFATAVFIPAANVTNNNVTAPTLSPPYSSVDSQLPTSDLSLRFVALGHGIQNYTCATQNSTPVALGALATLYDITALRTSTSSADWLPPIIVYMPISAFTIQYPPAYQDGANKFPTVGYHYFLADGTPVFNLTALETLFFAKRSASIKAPLTANKGPFGTGAIDWLYLKRKPDTYLSKGASEVYRVVTAGGGAPASCHGKDRSKSGIGMISVPYAAEYWFYD